MVLMPACLVLELITNTSGDKVRDLHTETKLVLGGSISHHNWETSDFLSRFLGQGGRFLRRVLLSCEEAAWPSRQSMRSG